MKDLITVIVPVYNRDRYLRETIDGVLNQTYENLEIFLIDDGSSDNALRIMNEYEKIDRRVRVITQTNRGICSSMKNVLKISSGKYFTRCDSDDINEPDRYERQLEFLKENNYDMVGCYIKCFGCAKEGQKRYLEKCVNSRMRTYKEQRNRIFLGQPITGSTMFCRSDVLKEVLPFNDSYSVVEDFYLSVMLHKAGKRISILEEDKLNYRVHEENLSLSNLGNVLYKHTEIAFEHLYKDIIKKKKRVIIFKKSNEVEGMREVIRKSFKDCEEKFTLITEDEVDEFFNNNIDEISLNDEILIFYGMMFKDYVKPLMDRGRYVFLKDIFLSGN